MYYSASWQLLEERIDSNNSTFAEEKCAQTVWGLRYIDDAVLRREDTNQDDDYADSGERTDYYITDPQFSVVAVVSDTGDLQESVAYSAYGEARHHYPADADGDVDGTDMLAFTNLGNLKSIDQAGYKAQLDLDRNGVVNSTDAAIANTNWNGKAALGAGLISDPAGPDSPIGYDGYVFNSETRLYTARLRHYEPITGRWAERDPLQYVESCSLYSYGYMNPVLFADSHGLQSHSFENSLLMLPIEGRYLSKSHDLLETAVSHPCSACRDGLFDLEYISQQLVNIFASQINSGYITGVASGNSVTFMSQGNLWSFTVGNSVEGYFTVAFNLGAESAPGIARSAFDDLIPNILGAFPDLAWAYIQHQDGDDAGAINTLCGLGTSIAAGALVGAEFGALPGFVGGAIGSFFYEVGNAAGEWAGTRVGQLVVQRSERRADKKHSAYLAAMWDAYNNAYQDMRSATDTACGECCKSCGDSSGSLE